MRPAEDGGPVPDDPAVTLPARHGAARRSALHLNLGCGAHDPPGWVNLDSSPGARLCGRPRLAALLRRVLPARLLPAPGWEDVNARWMDLTRPWPFDDGSAVAVYTSHFLEHLDADEGRHVLAEAHRVLCRGGLLRVIVPDLEAIAAQYEDDRRRRPAEAARRFLANTGFFEVRFPRTWLGLISHRIRRKNNHQVLHDEAGLRALLEDSGFTDARRCGPGDSADPAMAAIDQADRFENALCLEARRP